MTVARRMTFAFAMILCLSLATCFLGRRAWSEHSGVEVVEQGSSSPSSSSPLGGFLHVDPTVEVPFKQDQRRALKGLGVSGGGTAFSTGFEIGKSGGTSNLTKKTIIILSVLTVFLVVLVVAFYLWEKSKMKKDPHFSSSGYFKRKIAKMFTRTEKSDAVVSDAAAAEHKMTVDGPRLDHASKSRKQVSLNLEFKSTTT